MLILCSTNRALECLHVQSHILLSISYRIITHSKHDAWSEWATCSESLDRTSSCCIGTLTPSRKKKIHGHRLDELVRSPWLRIQWGHQRILLLSSCDFDQEVPAILLKSQSIVLMRWCEAYGCRDVKGTSPAYYTFCLVLHHHHLRVSWSGSFFFEGFHSQHLSIVDIISEKKIHHLFFRGKDLSSNLLAQQYHWPPSPQHN